jgi:hypothetical protein
MEEASGEGEVIKSFFTFAKFVGYKAADKTSAL